MKRWLVAVVAAGALVPGCECGPAGVDALRFACDAPADCAPGYACVAGVCSALQPSGLDGGECTAVPELCDNGADNDCDGLVDCDDPDCAAAECGPGKLCTGGVCLCQLDGGIVELVEQSCDDGFDNDCDGLVDCADPDCSRRPCELGSATRVCCGTSCVDLTSASNHCGGCGVSCKMGQSCVAATDGTISSGRCTCANNGHCPAAQTCAGSTCACADPSACAAGQACSGTPGLCHY